MANVLIGHVKGPQGDAATISVGTTTTGAAGSSAAVTNSGTTSAAVLNFTIPKGDKGDAGTPGVTDYATSSAAGLVRVGSDFSINSSNGTLSINKTNLLEDSLTSTSTSKALTAKQGKVLNDAVTKLNQSTSLETLTATISSSPFTMSELAEAVRLQMKSLGIYSYIGMVQVTGGSMYPIYAVFRSNYANGVVIRAAYGGEQLTKLRYSNTPGTWTEDEYAPMSKYGSLFKFGTYSASVTVAAGSGKNVTVSELGISQPSGYTAIGMRSLNSDNTGLVVCGFRPHNTGNANNAIISVRNVTNASITANVYCIITWMRQDAYGGSVTD